MSEIFKKIKRKNLFSSMTKSVLLALGIGFAAFGVPLLVLKLMKNDYKIGILLLISVAVAACAGALCFVILRKSANRIAISIDRKFSLHEKVQTMIEYQGENATMYQLQRDDASAALRSVYKKAIRVRDIWIYIASAVIGIALTVSAVAVKPPVTPPPEVEEVPFTISETQINALVELSATVRASAMTEPYKESIAVAIDIMTDELKKAETIAERDEAINKANTEILKQTDDSSLACEIISSLWGFEIESMKALAKAMNYYDPNVFDKYGDFVKAFEYTGESKDEAEIISATKEILRNAATSISLTVIGCKLPDNDPLYAPLNRLAPMALTTSEADLDSLVSLAESIDTDGYEITLNKLEILVDAMAPEITRALNSHQTNTVTGENAITQICNLFGILRPTFERPNLYESESSGGGDEGGPGMGGIGNGTVYGSDDLVYDPYTNTFVEYGVILDKYYELMFNKTLSDKYTKEEKDALEKYFAILYNGFDKTEKE